MLNQFYKYISNQMVSFFEKEATRNKIDRYFLYLPTNEIIANLYQAIGNHDSKIPFSYRHNEGTKSYETFALQLGNIKYVIATTNNTNIDFLVTLRNKMSEQKGDWENTSLILLCNTLNDSIRGGSRDLTGEGLPLHVSQIAGNLDSLLLTSNLNSIERKIASHYLNTRKSEHYLENSSFLDFEDVLSLVNKGTLASEDYRSLQYFYDSGLDDLIKEQELQPSDSGKWKQIEKKIDKRLTENNSEYEEIERIRSLGNPKDKLDEAYDKGGTRLNREDWFNVDFSEIEDWKESTKNKRAIEFFSEKVKVSMDSKPLTFWKRPKSDTPAGRRNWSFLIFNPNYKEGEKVEITIPFDRHTKKEFLNSTSQKVARTSGHSVIVELLLEQVGSTFGRVVYKHENAANSNYTFSFVVVASEEAFFQSIRSSFQVVATSKAKRSLYLTLDNQGLIFGDGSLDIELKEQGASIPMDAGSKVNFTPGLLDENDKNIRFTVITPRFEIPVEVADEALKTIPINGKSLWEKKQTIQSSFMIDPGAVRVEIENLPFVTLEEDRPFLMMEISWLKNRTRQATIKFNELITEQLVLPKNVEDSYDAFLEAIERKETIPSLLYYTDEILEKAEIYVKAYLEAIEDIRDQQIMTNEERGLFYLGTARDEHVIYMTPYSPLNVAYQLQITKESKGEKIDSNILNKLNAVYTLPYLVSYEGKLFKPTTESRLPEWHAFLPCEEVTVGETNSYLAQVVEEKLDQFCDHYEYLFSLDSKAALLLNIINIPNDKEVLRGIVDWLKKQIKETKNLSELRPIEVVAYKEDEDGYSAFDELNDMGNAEEIANRLGIKFSMEDYLAEDVLRTIQQVLRYSKRHISEKAQYSHITFYKMKTEEQVVKQLVKDAPSSINLNGLFTTVTSSKSDNGGYRVGFGTGDGSNVEQSLLTRFAVKINELAANMTDKGQNPYTKGIAFAMHIGGEDEDYLSSLYSQSHWLTFIDPVLDLKYFQESSDNIVIVHYSDQHSSSNHYDAITVTDKSNQYFSVIDEFLKSQKVTVSNENIEDVIQLFNTFNGEWLLRAVQGRAHDKREKMSIVSAIKQALLHFDKADVLWVPVSMEEIVRVAGSIKLSKKSGLFSGKTIGKRGNCSDDLLMMGLEQAEDGLKIHMYPVEVKIGLNDSHVIEKGIIQVKELNNRLNEQLIEQDTFDARFLRNFFTRLFINNASKMKHNRVWPEKDYTLTANVIDKLLNDEFQIVNTNKLLADYGQGLVISFKKGARLPKKQRLKGVIVLEFPEQSGYDTIAKPMDELMQKYRVKQEKVFSTPRLNQKANDTASQSLEINQVYGFESDSSLNSEQNIYSNNDDTVVIGRATEDVSVQDDVKMPPRLIDKNTAINNQIVTAFNQESALRSVRPLLGIEKEKSVFWEFDHSGLSNRHLIIGGRSGQGKTYFIQSLLRDLSKSNKSAIVVDYSSSYTKAQLDPVFLEELGYRFRERIVYHEGFPLNPFLRRPKEVAGVIGIEKPSEVARRVADVFSSVYRGFGPQQRNALYEAVKRGIEMYDDKMRMEHLLEILEDLEGYTNTTLSSITTRLVQFVDIDPFDYESKNQWEEYFAPGGNITIIQLEGYDQDEIKKLMAEFILWDLWYHTQNGTKDKPIPVILDEAQNLAFADGSPSAKILREGRKFGWSAWFATQTFNNFSKEELAILDNAGTKVYFNPAESEVRVLASRIGSATPEELRMLQKGQCLVLGQFMEEDQSLGNPTYHIVKVPAMNTR